MKKTGTDDSLESSKQHLESGHASPEEILTYFLKMSFRAQSLQDLRALSIYTTGPLFDELETVTEEQFKTFYKGKRLEWVDLKISKINKKDEESLILEYQLKLLDNTPGTASAELQNTRRALIVAHSNARWKISEIEQGESRISFKDYLQIQGWNPH